MLSKIKRRFLMHNNVAYIYRELKSEPTNQQSLTLVAFSKKDYTLADLVDVPMVYLHPTMKPTNSEIFCLVGAQDKYLNYYAEVLVNHSISYLKRTHQFSEITSKVAHKLIKKYTERFEPWYESILKK